MNPIANPFSFQYSLAVLHIAWRRYATGILALTLAACSPQAEVAEEPPLAGSTIGGEFQLRNSAGETVQFSDFEGQYRIVYFGFAFCPDACPTDMQRTIQGLNQFAESDPEAAANVQPIFVSVDPERDTGEVLDQFTSAFSDDLIGLTGSPEQLAEAALAFGAYFAVPEDKQDGAYLVDHSRTVLLFGPEGQPLAPLPADLGADAVAEELAKWVI